MKLIAAAYAPMNKNYSINTSIIGDYASFLKKNKVKGVFVNGSTGDFASLSLDERKDLISAWGEHQSDDFTIINHVASTNLNEAKELAKHSVDKANAIAVLAPYYFKPATLDILVQYCKEVAEEAPNLPFYYYHIPVLSGSYFKMIDFLEKVDKEIPNFAGLKYTYNDFPDFLKCKNYKESKYDIFFGIDEMFLQSLSLQTEGCVGSTYNHLAPLYLKIEELFTKNKLQEASDLQKKAIHFVEVLDSIGRFNGAGKSFMKTLGIDCGPSRYPHNTLTDQQLKKAVKEFEKIGLSSYFSE